MMINTYNTNTLESKFIKNLLLSTPLPVLDVVNDGDYIIKGCSYIYGERLILCTQSGFINGYLSTSNSKIDVNKRLLVATFEVTKIFHGEVDQRYFRTYTSNMDYYDHNTHRLLGEYLRRYKNLTNINLMPMYNCFDNEYVDDFEIHLYDSYTIDTDEVVILNIGLDDDSKYTNLFCDYLLSDLDSDKYRVLYNGVELVSGVDYEIDDESETISINSLNNKEFDYYGAYVLVTGNKIPKNKNKAYYYPYTGDYKVTIVPIKYNTEYTIAINCLSPYIITPILYDRNCGLLDKGCWVGNRDTLSDKTIVKGGTQFNKPYSISINIDDSKLYEYRKYLYLAIQLPNYCDSNIVVLEGNYVDNAMRNVIDTNKSNAVELNGKYISNISLLNYDCTTKIPYSNRLIEFLSENVITHNDDITDDIVRIHTHFYYGKIDPKRKIFFDDKLRSGIYNRMTKKDATMYYSYEDTTGFVDKDAEKRIMSMNSNEFILVDISKATSSITYDDNNSFNIEIPLECVLEFSTDVLVRGVNLFGVTDNYTENILDGVNFREDHRIDVDNNKIIFNIVDVSSTHSAKDNFNSLRLKFEYMLNPRGSIK